MDVTPRNRKRTPKAVVYRSRPTHLQITLGNRDIWGANRKRRGLIFWIGEDCNYRWHIHIDQHRLHTLKSCKHRQLRQWQHQRQIEVYCVHVMHSNVESSSMLHWSNDRSYYIDLNNKQLAFVNLLVIFTEDCHEKWSRCWIDFQIFDSKWNQTHNW